MPKMAEVLSKGDAEEDRAYDAMGDLGAVLSEVRDIFGGSDRQ